MVCFNFMITFSDSTRYPYMKGKLSKNAPQAALEQQVHLTPQPPVALDGIPSFRPVSHHSPPPALNPMLQPKAINILHNAPMFTF